MSPHSPRIVTKERKRCCTRSSAVWMANTQGERGDDRTPLSEGEISEGTSTISEETLTDFSQLYFCPICNNWNTSNGKDITEWALYLHMESKESEPEKSENDTMKRQKREVEGRSHLTKEKLGLRNNKFNITEEACFRGRSLRPRTVPWHRKHRLSPSVLQQGRSGKLGQAEEKSSLGFVQEHLHPGNKENENFLSF